MLKKDQISVIIVDDHQVVIDGLLSMLKYNEQIKFILTTTDPTQVIPMLEETPVDMLITDVMMPALPGNELAKKVKERFPQIKILALSMSGEGQLVSQMIDEANISGYMLKNISKTELAKALEKIAEGGIYFSKDVIEELQRANQRKKHSQEAHLTDREIEIIRLIEKEYNNKQIAEVLFISERTVETHRKNILRKTHTSTVIGLVKYAYEYKLI
ncbi:response regulator transcription factor [Terrimonas sp. NA20]|uniref:Response regulator transcription factor n=1 Tax=Terrimonas ginsenosidimutans TaxID=2908004 RepID=A0ABS9KTQ7_9BACT|nr:response regulator transcription factor [Terrimonas ginsenosidimutans]MCG2615669.1 response regulator transcription factor [Terrimonas ginsenosidimutans]